MPPKKEQKEIVGTIKDSEMFSEITSEENKRLVGKYSGLLFVQTKSNVFISCRLLPGVVRRMHSHEGELQTIVVRFRGARVKNLFLQGE